MMGQRWYANETPTSRLDDRPIGTAPSIAVMNRSQLILVLLLRAIAVAASQAIVSVFVIPRCGGPARNDSMTRVQIEQRKEPKMMLKSILPTIVIFSLVLCGRAAVTFAATPPFFVLDNGLHGTGFETVDAKLDLVKEIGFDGLSWRTDAPEHIMQVIDGAKLRRLKLFVIYVNLDLKDGKLIYDPRIKEIIALCKGTDTMIWPNLTSKQFKASDPAGDEVAVPGLRACRLLWGQRAAHRHLSPRRHVGPSR